MIPQCAFVLGAGLGTRLRPLTENRPKPLVPIYGKPLITFAFDHLLSFGVERFVVNTHHRAEAYESLVGAAYRGHDVSYRHEPVLLDTGGGIRNVADLLGDGDFIVYNGDVLADLPLATACAMHTANGNVATLILRSSGGPLQVRCDVASGTVTDIRDSIGGRNEPAFLFTGISILSPEVATHIPPNEVVSIIPIYLDLIRQGARIGGCVVDEGQWFDLGSIEAYLDAHAWLAKHRLAYSPKGWPEPMSPTAIVHPTATFEGFCSVEATARIGAGSWMKDSVIWPGACIEAGTRLERCVVRDGQGASGVLVGNVI